MTEEQINEAKKSGQVDGIDPCLMGCIFKKVGVVSIITFKGVLKLNCLVSPAFMVIPSILWECSMNSLRYLIGRVSKLRVCVDLNIGKKKTQNLQKNIFV